MSDVQKNIHLVRFLCSEEILKSFAVSSMSESRYNSSEMMACMDSNSLLDLAPLDSTPGRSNNNIFSSSFSNSGDLSISATDAVIDLFIELFELKERNNWLRHQAVVILLQQLFGGTVERRVTENLVWANDLGTAVNLLEWMLSYLWPNGMNFYQVTYIIRTNEQKKKTRSDSFSKLSSIFPGLFGGMVGRHNAKRGAERLLWIFQNKRLNQQLLYMLFDELIASLFPEISGNKAGRG